MATITKEGGKLIVELWEIERIEALRGGFEIPLESVALAEVVEAPIKSVHGLRITDSKLYGTYLPGETAVGVFLRDGVRNKPAFIAIHHDQKRGVRITLNGAKYSELLIGCDDPEALVKLLS